MRIKHFKHREVPVRVISKKLFFDNFKEFKFSTTTMSSRQVRSNNRWLARSDLQNEIRLNGKCYELDLYLNDYVTILNYYLITGSSIQRMPELIAVCTMKQEPFLTGVFDGCLRNLENGTTHELVALFLVGFKKLPPNALFYFKSKMILVAR